MDARREGVPGMTPMNLYYQFQTVYADSDEELNHKIREATDSIGRMYGGTVVDVSYHDGPYARKAVIKYKV